MFVARLLFIKLGEIANKIDRTLKTLGVIITKGVGTMYCALAFTALALLGLPAALRPSGEGLIAWIAQTFLQLVLLSIIIVGQNQLAQVSDAQAKETHDMVKSELRLLEQRHKDRHRELRTLINNHNAPSKVTTRGERKKPQNAK